MLALGWIAAAAVLWTPPPVNAKFDSQLGEDYPLPSRVQIVARDWFAGSAAAGAFSVCYVNAFQTQRDEVVVNRPD